MNFSYNWLQSFFKVRLPKPEKLAELLTMKAFEITEVKKTDKDFILDIDILPNRGPDCFSHQGIAREIAAITGLNYQEPPSTIKEDKTLKAKDFIKVEVKNKAACSRYTAKVITDVKVGLSPRWIRERLRVCGLRPISNIVDIANYVMLETGQPLHAFDFDKLESVNPKSQILNPKQIVVRFAKPREKIVTLDEEKYDLTEDILMIADAKNPIAIAGIKGGKIPEVDKKTKIIVLESANFNSKVIRRTSKEIDLKTDASWRFEHGIDPNLTEIAINRAAYLIQKIAKGKTAKGLIDFYPKKVLPKRIKMDLDYVESLLGRKISKKEIIDTFKRLGFQIVKTKPQYVEVGVPTFRLDINIPEDLIEEIGRIVGFEKIPSVFPTVSLIPPKRNLEIFWKDLTKNILKEAGFIEVYNYSFLSEKDISLHRLKSEAIEVENPVSIEQKYLRPSLIPNLLKNIQKNQKNFGEIKIFELGKIFQNKKTEKRMLAGVMTGEVFYQLKGAVDLLLNKLGISNVWYNTFKPTSKESETSVWNSKKCAEIKVDNQEIGFLGQISPKILDNLKISLKVTAFDIDFEKLQKLCSEETIYQPISPYPAAIRDIAVLVPRVVKVVEVLNKINTVGGKLIRDIDLFDIYEGDKISEGKKNLAFHIIYQAENRTLSSKEIDEIQNKIIKNLEKKPEWQVRK